jgi:hypothetical protein
MKTLLVATTALIGVASLAFAGPLSAREPQSSHYGLSANDKFLCDYGAFDINFVAQGFVSSGLVEHWIRAAVPVTGKGKEINAIEIADKLSTTSSFRGLSIAIYSSRDNKPYKELISTTTLSSGCPATLSLGPMNLQRGTKYWIVEKTDPEFASPSIPSRISWSYEWFYRKTKPRNALWQSGSSVCTGSRYESCHLRHNTPWAPLTAGTPYVKLISSARSRGLAGAHGGATLPGEGISPPQSPSKAIESRGLP